ncbi:hypothetical protein [Rhizobium phage RHph_X2_28B]|uniref:hypothetical protein n=1 Tax=Rhizobium phage RHph_X2_28B TaxID=2836086 RepID=UPI00232945C9|nr:hypothetical protein PP751_gp019 [Rhizobium phage RHph_X2_28B]QWY83471.1 hypothetical protein [Rhizobium phage RHph_X2_28B]QWY83707.1 hypothetical protein [Rhizobium phage RHph_X3_15]
MARNLLETITERAIQNHGEEYGSEAWFDTADKFKQELITEGLCKTANSVDQIIKQKKRVMEIAHE